MDVRRALLLAVALLTGLASAKSCQSQCYSKPGKDGLLLPERELEVGKDYGDQTPGRIPYQYAEELRVNLKDWKRNREYILRVANESRALFWDPAQRWAPLPRSLDRQAFLPFSKAPVPPFYSSTLGGPHLMWQFLRICQQDESQTQYCSVATRFADAMLRFGTDRYGTRSTPLFSSLLVITKQPFLPAITLAPNGAPTNFPRVYNADLNNGGPQRFTYFGANVLNDQPLYLTLYALTDLTGDKRYAAAADAALSYFLASCAAPESGLYPWGEHAQLDLRTDRWADPPSDDNHVRYHELIPLESGFMEKLWSLGPGSMQKYLSAIFQAHFLNLARPDRMVFDRHAALWARTRPIKEMDDTLLVFPRHAEIWMRMWCYALAQSRDARWKASLSASLSAFLAGLASMRQRLCGGGDPRHKEFCSVEVYPSGLPAGDPEDDSKEYILSGAGYCVDTLPSTWALRSQFKDLLRGPVVARAVAPNITALNGTAAAQNATASGAKPPAQSNGTAVPLVLNGTGTTYSRG